MQRHAKLLLEAAKSLAKLSKTFSARKLFQLLKRILCNANPKSKKINSLL